MKIKYQVRDSIHGFVELTEKEKRIVDTPIFQRLRRIGQLALASLVYPGANHTRFEHSLGTLHVASKMVELLQEKTNVIKKKDLEPVRLAALLHDLGHGPFSHVSEYLLERYCDRKNSNTTSSSEQIHESITAGLIKNDEDIKKILGSNLLKEVIGILTGEEGRDIRKDIVSGPLDADKLDYILRDAHYAGVRYGSFDLPKILESLIPIGQGSSCRLGITEEGVHAVEQLVMAKHHMTVQVYRHRVRAITDAMIIRGLELAIDKRDDKMGQLYKYKNTKAFLENYKEWWDSKVIDYIRLKSSVKPAKEIFNRLFNRRLFKLIHKRDINEREMKNVDLRNKFLRLCDQDRRYIEKKIASHLKAKSYNVILNIVTIKNPTYRSPADKISEDEIQILLKDNVPKYLKEIHWSMLSLPNVEEKQQYVEVYAPGENWSELSDSKRKKFLKSLDRAVTRILYG